MDFDPFCYFCSFRAAKNATVGGDLNFRFHMLLKGAVIPQKLCVGQNKNPKNFMHFVIIIIFFTSEKFLKSQIFQTRKQYHCLDTIMNSSLLFRKFLEVFLVFIL